MIDTLNGKKYADLIAKYICTKYSNRNLSVYREISLGKSIIGKNRRLDILLVQQDAHNAYAIECKYQATHGTTDEKIPYAIADMQALHIPGCIIYAGEGFSSGVLHLLQSSPNASYCLPDADLNSSSSTRELDHVLAMRFNWWDIIVGARKPFSIDDCS